MATGDLLKLERGGLDKSGNRIVWIYAKKIPEYGVYSDPTRVSVHFADEDVRLEAKQRATLAVLSPLRGQIAGLIDGWRRPVEIEEDHHAAAGQQANGGEPAGGEVGGPEQAVARRHYGPGPIGWFQKSRTRRNLARAARYDRRVADALIMGLEGSTPEAVALLTDIRNDIVAERKSIAQADYMLWAAFAGLAFLLVVWFFSTVKFDPPRNVHLIWTGASAGTLGAFFSIATGLRRRTILIDLQKWDNRSDAILRIAVGTIGAGILLVLLLAKWVELNGVTDLLTGTDVDAAVVMALAIGFVAGFSERAVGDLLAKAGESLTEAAPSHDVAVEQAKAAAAVAAQTPLTPAPASDAEAVLVAVDPVMDALDESPCDSPPVEGEVPTADVDLPVAVGGVSADVPAPAAPAEPPAGKDSKKP